ncbi:MAG: Nucleoid occlusion protein [Candidatus Bathyarchaeota archaeon BA1]|nr:MAG: Nucleoid occlusion protein [Candidatus Bathyarchaeota archaeon BA1]
MISVEEIDLPPLSLRTDVSRESLEELAESIETEGLIQPILVRPKKDRYELIVGERRVRAAIYANVPKIPAIIRDISDEEASRSRLIENINRRDLEIWERVDGIRFHMKMYGLTHKQMADKLHVSPETLKNWFSLADRTSPKIKSSPEFRKLPPAYLMRLTKYDDETQERFARAIISKGLGKYQILKLTDLYDQDPRADIDELARRLKEEYAEIVTLVPKEEAEKVKRKRAEERKRAKKKVREEKLKSHLRPREKPKEEKPKEEKALVVRVMPKELEELDIPFIKVRSLINGIKPTMVIETNKWRMEGSNHFDLMLAFSHIDTFLWVSLETLCRLYGIEVMASYRRGDWDSIIKHDTQDLVMTEELYKKFFL